MAETKQQARSRQQNGRSRGGNGRSNGGSGSPLEGKGQFSSSTLRAKWVESPEDRPDRKGQTLATRDHETIKRWAEERNAAPATVGGTEHGKRAGVLRFIFDRSADPGRLEEIDWERWFVTFDERELVFLYQQTLRNGNQSNFFRFDSPHREDA